MCQCVLTDGPTAWPACRSVTTFSTAGRTSQNAALASPGIVAKTVLIKWHQPEKNLEKNKFIEISKNLSFSLIMDAVKAVKDYVTKMINAEGMKVMLLDEETVCAVA